MNQKRFVLPAFLAALAGIHSHATDLYVDPVRGDDHHAGSSPREAFRSIEKARDHIRANGLNRNMSEDLDDLGQCEEEPRVRIHGPQCHGGTR